MPQEIKRDGAVINYHMSGQGDITLLFVHGSYIDQNYWSEQVSFFSPHYTVVTIDLPGHGKSGRDRKNWSLEGFAEDVIEVIKTLHLENVILIGHSIAGDVNLMAAVRYPEPIIGFIGVDNFKNAATPLPAQYQCQVSTILENLKKDFENTNEQYARMALLTSDAPSTVSNRVIRDYRNAYRPMGMATMPEVFEIYKMEKELLPKLHVKLDLINVDYIPTNEEPLKQLTTHGFEVHHMEGASHYPMIESPEEFNVLLEKEIHKIEREIHVY